MPFPRYRLVDFLEETARSPEATMRALHEHGLLSENAAEKEVRSAVRDGYDDFQSGRQLIKFGKSGEPVIAEAAQAEPDRRLGRILDARIRNFLSEKGTVWSRIRHDSPDSRPLTEEIDFGEPTEAVVQELVRRNLLKKDAGPTEVTRRIRAAVADDSIVAPGKEGYSKSAVICEWLGPVLNEYGKSLAISTGGEKPASNQIGCGKALLIFSGFSVIVKLLINAVVPASLPDCAESDTTDLVTQMIRDQCEQCTVELAGIRELDFDATVQRRSCRGQLTITGQKVTASYVIDWKDRDAKQFSVTLELGTP